MGGLAPYKESLKGSPFRAPYSRMQNEATELPILPLSCMLFSCSKPYKNPAANASPAPVVSTTSVGYAAIKYLNALSPDFW